MVKNNYDLTGFADEISPNLDKQIEVIKGLEMHYIEMRGVNGRGLVDHTLEEAKKIKQQLDAGNIRISAIGSPIGKINIKDDFDKHMELFRHTVELAQLMGTRNIRMFSFFIPREENAPAEQFRDEVMERLGKMLEYAKQNDVVLLHENEKGIYGDIASRCLEIMQNFYGEHFKAVFDFANFVQCHQDTKEAYELLRPYIEYIHIKDALWDNGSVVPAGSGDGQVEEILRRLFESGYHGFLSLEPHLTEFTGFTTLEDGGKIAKVLSGPEAFTLAHQELLKILNTI
ncbi:MAG: sugar phosphate isomerase/epimerase [Acetatifactor sp.]|nr:sugar phosphate isomerase/epimerase [Acetatifactor sp.]